MAFEFEIYVAIAIPYIYTYKKNPEMDPKMFSTVYSR